MSCGKAFFGQVGQHWRMDKWSRHCLEERQGPARCCHINSCQHIDNFRQHLCCQWLLPSCRVGCLHVPFSSCDNKGLVGTAVLLRLSLSLMLPDCWQLTSCQWQCCWHDNEFYIAVFIDRVNVIGIGKVTAIYQKGNHDIVVPGASVKLLKSRMESRGKPCRGDKVLLWGQMRSVWHCFEMHTIHHWQ